jgi:hypothetical protein
MRLQHTGHRDWKVIKVRAIHHNSGDSKEKPLSTVEVDILDGYKIKKTTLKYPEVVDMNGGRDELFKFGSTFDDPVI